LVSILPLSTILLLDFWTVPAMVCFWLTCYSVIFHVSTLLSCPFSCFYFAALSFSCF
jgi:hypothetical protein